MEFAPGVPPASPMPTPIRVQRNVQVPIARPVRVVIADQTTSEIAMMLRRL